MTKATNNPNKPATLPGKDPFDPKQVSKAEQHESDIRKLDRAPAEKGGRG
jgi:hypothetical protein